MYHVADDPGRGPGRGLIVVPVQALTAIQENAQTFGLTKLAAIVAVSGCPWGFMSETLVSFLSALDRAGHRRRLRMSNSIYAALTRQIGPMNEMRVVRQQDRQCQHLRFRARADLFLNVNIEHGRRTVTGPGRSGLVDGPRRGCVTTSETQGSLKQTGDLSTLAIEGEGFFFLS